MFSRNKCLRASEGVARNDLLLSLVIVVFASLFNLFFLARTEVQSALTGWQTATNGFVLRCCCCWWWWFTVQTPAHIHARPRNHTHTPAHLHIFCCCARFIHTTTLHWMSGSHKNWDQSSTTTLTLHSTCMRHEGCATHLCLCRSYLRFGA